MIIYASFFFCTLIAGEVIFDQAQPDFPPDFIFGPQDVEFIPNIGEIKVSTVGDIDVYIWWNSWISCMRVLQIEMNVYVPRSFLVLLKQIWTQTSAVLPAMFS